jgi:protein involved in polysaccharide export with SLBB domain
MWQRSPAFGVCAFVAIVLAACSATGPNPIISSRQAVSSYASVDSRDKAERPYILGPSDRVRLKDYDDENLSDEYEVNSDGFVSIPLVGRVRAAGLTTNQLEKAIASRMRGKIAHDPKINVEIATYAPFYIYGEVKKAGVYPFQPGLTVADAIATAGGLTYRADESAIYLQHPGAGTSQIVRLDVPMRVVPGDNIRVSERMF